MQYSPDIFRSYDIRGIYGQEFDDEFGYRLGIALVKHLGAKKMVIARDMRDTSVGLAAKVIEGMRYAGANVIDIDITSTPFFYFAVQHLEADGGIMVTASHLGPEYNGFKMVRSGAVIVGGATNDFDQLRTLLQDKKPEYFKADGTVEKQDLKDIFAQSLFDKSGIEPQQINLKVQLKANTMIVDEIGAVLLKLGVPIDYENPDVIFEFDDDGDRSFAGDPGHDPIRGDQLVGLLAAHYFAGKTIVHDVKFSPNVIDYLTKEKGCTMIRSKTGHGYIKPAMVKHDADLGGEFSSHVMYKTFGNAESHGMTVLLVLYLLQKLGQPLHELIEPMNTWANSREIKFYLKDLQMDKQEILAAVKAKYNDGQIDELDGVDVRYDDWRLLVRPSGTHPALICIVEGATKEIMEAKKQELFELLGSDKAEYNLG